MIENKKEYIINEFSKCRIMIDEHQAEQLLTFYEMLVEKNKVMNLTGITEFTEVVRKHFIDSVINVKIDEESNIIDIGTGAGFPGIPLKILYPSIRITLLDSLNKRILFLREVVEALELENVELIHGRAEELGQDKKYREKYDYACSRAVANLSSLCEYCLPFVKTNGYMISYKSSADDELRACKNAVKTLGGDDRNIEIERFILPEGDEKRSLIYIRKIKNTPGRYPRKAGTPAKEPL